MRPKTKRRVSSLFALLIVGSVALLVPGFAQERLDARIGSASPSTARHSHQHDVTVDSLKQGKTEYQLKGSSEGSHRVVFTKQQLADILNGTTVIVQSEKSQEAGNVKAHQHRVTVTVKTEERERSGW